jgi:hypothetical protein
MERATGVEPVTSSLGSWHSTTELRPPAVKSRVAASECQIRKRAEGEKNSTRKRQKKQTSGASSLDPHLYPPPRHGGGNKSWETDSLTRVANRSTLEGETETHARWETETH